VYIITAPLHTYIHTCVHIHAYTQERLESLSQALDTTHRTAMREKMELRKLHSEELEKVKERAVLRTTNQLTQRFERLAKDAEIRHSSEALELSTRLRMERDRYSQKMDERQNDEDLLRAQNDLMAGRVEELEAAREGLAAQLASERSDRELIGHFRRTCNFLLAKLFCNQFRMRKAYRRARAPVRRLAALLRECAAAGQDNLSGVVGQLDTWTDHENTLFHSMDRSKNMSKYVPYVGLIGSLAEVAHSYVEISVATHAETAGAMRGVMVENAGLAHQLHSLQAQAAADSQAMQGLALKLARSRAKEVQPDLDPLRNLDVFLAATKHAADAGAKLKPKVSVITGANAGWSPSDQVQYLERIVARLRGLLAANRRALTTARSQHDKVLLSAQARPLFALPTVDSSRPSPTPPPPSSRSRNSHTGKVPFSLSLSARRAHRKPSNTHSQQRQPQQKNTNTLDVGAGECITTLEEVCSEHDAAALKTHRTMERMERQLRRAQKENRLQHLAKPKHTHTPPAVLPIVAPVGKRQANREIRRSYGLS
jgi:hypothetical protein